MERQLIGELQEAAQDLSTPLESSLLKCMVLAHKLDLQELLDWATAEAEGYSRSSEVPSYRLISPSRSVAHVTNGVRYEHRVIGKGALPRERWAEMDQLRVTQSVGALERIGADGSFISVWPDYLKQELSQNFTKTSGYWVLDAWYELAPTAFTGILSLLRSRILRFTFDIERSASDQNNEGADFALTADGVARIFSETILNGGT